MSYIYNAIEYVVMQKAWFTEQRMTNLLSQIDKFPIENQADHFEKLDTTVELQEPLYDTMDDMDNASFAANSLYHLTMAETPTSIGSNVGESFLLSLCALVTICSHFDCIGPS